MNEFCCVRLHAWWFQASSSHGQEGRAVVGKDLSSFDCFPREPSCTLFCGDSIMTEMCWADLKVAKGECCSRPTNGLLCLSEVKLSLDFWNMIKVGAANQSLISDDFQSFQAWLFVFWRSKCCWVLSGERESTLDSWFKQWVLL